MSQSWTLRDSHKFETTHVNIFDRYSPFFSEFPLPLNPCQNAKNQRGDGRRLPVKKDVSILLNVK